LIEGGIGLTTLTDGGIGRTTFIDGGIGLTTLTDGGIGRTTLVDGGIGLTTPSVTKPETIINAVDAIKRTFKLADVMNVLSGWS
jgi:hypothetical protein